MLTNPVLRTFKAMGSTICSLHSLQLLCITDKIFIGVPSPKIKCMKEHQEACKRVVRGNYATEKHACSKHHSI